jgi:hypothetical protein
MARKRIATSKRKCWLQQCKTGVRRFLFKSSKPKRAYKRRRKPAKRVGLYAGRYAKSKTKLARHAMKTRKYRYVATMRMNPSYHNIESKKSPFGNYYIGYGGGYVFKITGESGDWIAEPASNVSANKGKQFKRIYSYSLRGMSDKLAKL